MEGVFIVKSPKPDETEFRLPKKEQKAEERFKARIPFEQEIQIQCSDWDQFRTEHAENISEGGIFVKTDHPLSPGTQFRLKIRVGDRLIETEAQVIWTKEFGPTPGRISGMGARFLSIDSATQLYLRDMIQNVVAD